MSTCSGNLERAMELFREGATTEEMYEETGINLNMAKQEANAYDKAIRRKNMPKRKDSIPAELLRRWDVEVYQWYQNYKKKKG